MALRACHYRRRRTGAYYPAAMLAALRSQVDDPVRGLDHVEVVLDYYYRIAVVYQPAYHFEQLLDICGMQAGSRLVHQVQGAIATGGGEFRRQFQPLGLGQPERVFAGCPRRI